MILDDVTTEDVIVFIIKLFIESVILTINIFLDVLFFMINLAIGVFTWLVISILALLTIDP